MPYPKDIKTLGIDQQEKELVRFVPYPFIVISLFLYSLFILSQV